MALTEIGARLRLVGAGAFGRDARGVATDVGAIATQADRADRKLTGLQRASRLASGGIRGLASAAPAAAAGVGFAAVAVAGLSWKVLQLATDAGETASKFQTVFGDAAPRVAQYIAKVNSEFGVTTKSLQDATAMFGVFGQSAGLPTRDLAAFSTGLAQAALDLGSFYNVDTEEAFAALSSGLSGESEPLKRFAIFMSDANLNALALAKGLGKTTQQMTEGEKIALRGQFILANLGKAQGDLGRTSGGLANQQRALRNRLEETGTILGKALLPGATRVATALNGQLRPAMESLRAASPGIERSVSRAAEGLIRFGGALVAAGRAGGLRGVVAEVDRLTGAGGGLVSRFQTFMTTARNVGVVLRDVAWPTAERLARLFGAAMGFAANHTRVAYYALGIFLARARLLAVARAAVIGYAVASGIAAAATGRHTTATTLNAAATRAQTVAHVAGNVALRVGAVSMAAWTAATRLATVAAKAGRIAAAAMWLAATGPVGVAVLAIGGAVIAVKNLYDRFESVRRVLDGVWGAVQRVVEWVGRIDFPGLPSWLGGGGDNRPPGRYAGGPMTPGRPYLVGEYRPEVVVPTMPSRVIPSVPAAQAQGLAGGQPVVIHVTSVLDGREIGRSTVRYLQDQQARR